MRNEYEKFYRSSCWLTNDDTDMDHLIFLDGYQSLQTKISHSDPDLDIKLLLSKGPVFFSNLYDDSDSSKKYHI
jgi:hypothetical protein